MTCCRDWRLWCREGTMHMMIRRVTFPLLTHLTPRTRIWLPVTAIAAVLLGVLVALVVQPDADRRAALRGIASPEPAARADAWAWFTELPPGGSRSRVVVLLDRAPLRLSRALADANLDARRDAATALVVAEGLKLQDWPSPLRASLSEALASGSADERRLAEIIAPGRLHDGDNDVTMHP